LVESRVLLCKRKAINQYACGLTLDAEQEGIAGRGPFCIGSSAGVISCGLSSDSL